MLIKLKSLSICDGVITEAKVGQIAYRDISGAKTSEGDAVGKIILDGELLLTDEELSEYEGDEKEFYQPEIKDAGAPFGNWKDLIDAISQRSPKSRALARFLEENPYHSVLRRLMPGVDEEGNRKLEDSPFVLTSNELAALQASDNEMLEDIKYDILQPFGISFEQMVAIPTQDLLKMIYDKEIEELKKDTEEDIAIGMARSVVDKIRPIIMRAKSPDFNQKLGQNQSEVDTPADYNRWWFNNVLRKYVPRALEPEAHGGKRVISGAVGSPKELGLRRGASIAPRILEDEKDNIVEEIRTIFGVMPEDWVDSIFGSNNELTNIKLAQLATHLAKKERGSSTIDYEDLQRHKRVLMMLSARVREKFGREPEGWPKPYKDAIENYKSEIEEIEGKSRTTGKGKIVKLSPQETTGFMDAINRLKEVGQEIPDDLIPEEEVEDPWGYFKVFFTASAPTDQFLSKFRDEVRQNGIKKAETVDLPDIPGKTAKGEPGQYVVQTSLSGISDLAKLLDPEQRHVVQQWVYKYDLPPLAGKPYPQAERWSDEQGAPIVSEPFAIARQKMIKSGGKIKRAQSLSPGIVGFKDDLFDLLVTEIQDQADGPISLVRVDNYGNFVFKMEKVGEKEWEESETQPGGPPSEIRKLVAQKTREELASKKYEEPGMPFSATRRLSKAEKERMERKAEKERLRNIKFGIKSAEKPIEPDYLKEILKSIEDEPEG